MMKRQRNLGGVLGASLLVVLVTACTDLGAVRNWADTSLEAAQFTEVVATYADTPQRLAVYDSAGAAEWQNNVPIRAAQADALILQLDLVADYMAALALLADDKATDYSEDMGALTSAMQKTGWVGSDGISAAGGLISTLLNAATEAWREDQVTELIEEANGPLQTLLAGSLRDIVDQDFRRDLQIEAGIQKNYFDGLLDDEDASPAAKAALGEWLTVRQAENSRRQDKVDTYLQVLDQIAEGHQKLYDNRNELDGVALAKDLFKLAKKVRSNVKDLVKS